jgi:hypothetical protein
MSDSAAPASTPFPREISADELLPRWEAFRAGSRVICPRDGGPMAVAVDGVAHAYRLICVSCGATSPWFESQPAGIHLRTGTSSMPAARLNPTDGEREKP